MPKMAANCGIKSSTERWLTVTPLGTPVLPLALRWGLYYLVMFLVTLSFICVTETSGFLYANF